jgi:hypothetical protein
MKHRMQTIIAHAEKGKTMSDEYIKREDTIKAVHEEWDECINYDGSGRQIASYTEDAIDDLPSADVAPVRHGRWEVIDAEEPRRYGCSECKRLSWNMENYCGNCGARMDGEK